jgi:eukaryotic-like serine/threonine-protein kinase
MTMTPSPKLIGKYEILEELGRGGFAVVYKARDVELDRIVALKVLRPALGDDPDFVARFKQEARAAAKLKHPHIVTVYDAIQIDGQLIIAMQYVEGRTLRDELAQGPLPFDRTLVILEQIASALDYAHQRGIVHRDVKPANILLEDTGQEVQATLLDFGLAKAMEASTALTSQGTLLGSPEYMAPEQADPNRASEIGPATDRYALGIVAYQLLAGRVPFPGNTPATLNAHLNLKPTDPHTLRAEVSPQISAILMKMLAKSPVERYTSASEFVTALRKAAEPPDIHPIPAGPSRWLRRALIGAIAVIAIAVVGYVVTRLIQPAAQPPAATKGASTLMPAASPAATIKVTLAPSALAAGSLQTRTTDGMTMVYVPAGTFKMGSDAGDDEQPVHDVTLDAFWIDRTEVTNAQYAACVAAKKCSEPSIKNSATQGSYYDEPQFASYPRLFVTWDEAYRYCEWAGGQLPTEAQWEYAARGPDAHRFPWGNEAPTDQVLNYQRNVRDTTAVDSYPSGASWVGALDMAGNAWEWVNDWYAASYADSSQLNSAGPASGTTKVLRGGSWHNTDDYARSAFRGNLDPNTRYDDLGFRCVMAQMPAVTSTPTPIPIVTPVPPPTTESTLGVGSTRTRTTDGMTMVYVPGGTFKMGSDTGADDERPIHDVTLDSFWIDRTEVTNTAFAKFVADTSYRTDAEKTGTGWVFDASKSQWSETQGADWQHPRGPGSNLSGRDDHPVVQVSKRDALAYCEWVGGQLPTEAQWEYAARGTNNDIYPWGNDQPNDELLNYNQKIGDTTAAASYQRGASWAGALDMAGNVREWVLDVYGEYPSLSQTNPTGPASAIYAVLRGGSWSSLADNVRSANRDYDNSVIRIVDIGFRCVAAGPGE